MTPSVRHATHAALTRGSRESRLKGNGGKLPEEQPPTVDAVT
jgi:hypothetical protein